MKALIAFDKFKDALSAPEICQTARDALAAVQPDWEIATAPLADGGDGFCDTLTSIAQGSLHEVAVTGPLGQPAQASYGMVHANAICPSARQMLALPDSVANLAIVELAQSSGIAMVPPEERSPWTTNTYGIGQVFQHAVKSKADAILIGLGGSASNDLGLCCLQALGYQFLDTEGKTLSEMPTPFHWDRIAAIKAPSTPFPLPVRIACDVENPLLGANGASAVFGPQKGLRPEDLEKLDGACHRLATLLCQSSGVDASAAVSTPGAGAAGGTAFGLMVGLEGKILPGAELVFAWSNLDAELRDADLVITGEGRFDQSSLQGKGPGALAQRALAAGKTVHVLAGSLGEVDLAASERLTMEAISPSDMPLELALPSTGPNLQKVIAQRFAAN